MPQIKTATGGGPVAMALQDKVAQAWVNFAQTGNPEPAGAGVEAVHDGESAGDGVRHRQPVGRRSRDDKLVSLLPAPAGRGGGPGRGGTAPTGRQ